MRSLKLYFRLVGISVQTQLQYRSSLALQTLGQFVLYVTEFAAVAGLFLRFGSIAGWGLGEAALLFGFADLSFSTADALARGFDLVGQQVKRGDFDRVLARPLSPFLQVLGSELTLRRFGRFLEGAIIFAWAWSVARPEAGPEGIAAIILGWLGAVATFVSIVTIQGALSFWTVEGLEIMNALSYGGRQVASYPMTAYRGFLRHLFLFAVPIGCSVYVPVCTLLHRPAFAGWPWWLGLVTPFAALPFAGLAALAWRAGIARYEGTGS
jgi:ABC-2 type transport system permease protein